jgi:hypothetical protein
MKTQIEFILNSVELIEKMQKNAQSQKGKMKELDLAMALGVAKGRLIQLGIELEKMK